MGALANSGGRYFVRPIPVSRKQSLILQSDQFLTGFVGGRGAGKTRTGAIWISNGAKHGYPCMCISPDSNVVRETSFPTFLETVEYSGQYISHVMSPIPKITFRTRDNGVANIVFKGAEKPDKLRGPNKAMLWLDEASIVSKEAFEIAIAMCRYKRKLSPVLATFTPRGFKHWTFEQFYQRVDSHELLNIDPRRIVYFAGNPYVAKSNSFLAHCATKDNPWIPKGFVENIGGNYSSRLREQELEGLFLEIAGLMFARANFRLVDEAPVDARRVRYWDKASTPGDGCYSAGVLLARTREGKVFVEHVIRGQWSAHQRNEVMRQVAEIDYQKYHGSVLTYIEQEGAGSGKEISDQMIVMLGKYPVYTDSSSTSSAVKLVGGVKLPGDAKIRRAAPFSAQVEAGNVYIVAGQWNSDFLDEISMFPDYTFCDQVDAVSGAYNKLAEFGADGMTPDRYNVTPEVRQYGRTVELTDADQVVANPFRSRLPWNR